MSQQLEKCPNPRCDRKWNTRSFRQHVGSHWVRCKCGVCGPIGKSREEAARLWNQRPESALARSYQELVETLKYMIEMREIGCLHKHEGPDGSCAKCKADAALAHAAEVKRG